MNKSSIIFSIFASALLATAGCAQSPPPPTAAIPAPRPAGAGAEAPAPPVIIAAGPQPSTRPEVTETGAIRDIIYGPQGEVQAVILRSDRIVSIAPELGAQMQMTLSKGAAVSVTGSPKQFGRQRQLFAQSVQINGQSFVAAAPAAGLVPAGPALAGPGRPPAGEPPPPSGEAPKPPPPGAQPATPPPPPQ
jgi:hypothetical protein